MTRTIKMGRISDTVPQLTAALIATLNCVSEGMHYGWTSPMLPLLRSKDTPVKITRTDETWLEASYFIGRISALPLSSYLVTKIGRKYSILLASGVALISWMLIGFAYRVEFLYCARLLCGAAANMNFIATPMYLAEISDKRIRGFVTSLGFVLMYFGSVVIFTVASFCPYFVSSVVGASLLVLQLIIFPLMPPSPYFLVHENRLEEAKSALGKLRTKGSNVEEEFMEIVAAVGRQNEKKARFLDLFLIPSNRRATFIATVLVIVENFTGMNAVVMNFHTIASETHVSQINPKYTGIFFSCIAIFGAIVCWCTADIFGRKFLLILSASLTGVCLLALSVYFNLKEFGFEIDNVKWIPLTAIIVYAIAFKLGLNILPNVLVSEIFADNIKGYGCPWTDGIGTSFSFISIVFYKYFVDAVGYHVPFYVYSGVAFASILFVGLFVFETKGKTLDEIQLILERKK